jgi:Mg/Co/Ni transporter MgtE
MLVARIYGWMWLLLAAVAVTVYLNDSMNFQWTMGLGFIASVLAGAGSLALSPVLMAEENSSGRNALKQKNPSPKIGMQQKI